MNFRQRITHDYWVRLHMSLILAAVIASGALASKAMLELGVRSLRLRYPLAVLVSYLVFLGLIRVWIWYVSLRTLGISSAGNLIPDNVDLPCGSGGGGSAVQFGGGSSGGGGASASWDDNLPVGTSQLTADVPAKSGGWFSSKLDFDFDFGDDGWVLVLLAVLVVGIVCAGGYLIYAAPHFLPEAASQAFLASALTRVSKKEHHDWMPGVLRATAIPFAVVFLLAGTLGWVAHSHCPSATRLVDALHCQITVR